MTARKCTHSTLSRTRNAQEPVEVASWFPWLHLTTTAQILVLVLVLALVLVLVLVLVLALVLLLVLELVLVLVLVLVLALVWVHMTHCRHRCLGAAAQSTSMHHRCCGHVQ